MKKKNYTTIILVLVFFAGLSLLLYPTISNYWNSMRQTKAIIDYDAALSNIDEADYEALLAQADEYNQKIREINFPLKNYDQVSGYNEALNVVGTGIMGYITIPLINVEIPIYHGTSEGVLTKAVGHMEGSSLPVGGESTHCVLSAHRGLPSAKLFTDLDRMNEGDIFVLTTLNQVLTYEVDQILIVEPHQSESLEIVAGEDYCTLITCTPYGINSHRLLVRGTRIENIEAVTESRVAVNAVPIEPLLIAPIVAIPILLVLLIGLLVRPKKKPGGDIFEDE